ncbi:COX assembly mitochondrial protein homolog [Calliopsis andreniformis]|uniref:COX assembly mitochondrial protein homolog n=1 Tax=Calliopsis andreniformis TaxID=337506 RepID=UPI003FCE3D93
MKDNVEHTVLPAKLGGGPHNLGDPNDKSLRKVEKEVLIPQKMRDKARTEKCSEVVKEFSDCCKKNRYLMVIRCRGENSSLRECLGYWFNNEKFKEECTQEYLHERSEYRRTGIPVRRKTDKIRSF